MGWRDRMGDMARERERAAREGSEGEPSIPATDTCFLEGCYLLPRCFREKSLQYLQP